MRQSTGIGSAFSFCFLFPPHFSHLTLITTANEQSHQVPNKPVSAAGLKRAFTQPMAQRKAESGKQPLYPISAFLIKHWMDFDKNILTFVVEVMLIKEKAVRLYRYNAWYWYWTAPWGWVIEGSKRDGWWRLVADGLPVNMTLEHRACISTSKSWYIKGLKMH